MTEVLGRDIRANDPRMCAGYPARKLPLWADFSFLKPRNARGGCISPCRPARVQNTILSGTEKGTPKNFCDKDFAELSGELSGASCLKTLVLMGNDR